jgi:hypothetical protein
LKAACAAAIASPWPVCGLGDLAGVGLAVGREHDRLGSRLGEREQLGQHSGDAVARRRVAQGAGVAVHRVDLVVVAEGDVHLGEQRARPVLARVEREPKPDLVLELGDDAVVRVHEGVIEDVPSVPVAEALRHAAGLIDEQEHRRRRRRERDLNARASAALSSAATVAAVAEVGGGSALTAAEATAAVLAAARAAAGLALAALVAALEALGGARPVAAAVHAVGAAEVVDTRLSALGAEALAGDVGVTAVTGGGEQECDGQETQE